MIKWYFNYNDSDIICRITRFYHRYNAVVFNLRTPLLCGVIEKCITYWLIYIHKIQFIFNNYLGINIFDTQTLALFTSLGLSFILSTDIWFLKRYLFYGYVFTKIVAQSDYHGVFIVFNDNFTCIMWWDLGISSDYFGFLWLNVVIFYLFVSRFISLTAIKVRHKWCSYKILKIVYLFLLSLIFFFCFNIVLFYKKAMGGE